MIRWRTVGLIDVPTDDGRVIRGPVQAGGPIPLLRVPSPAEPGHHGSEVIGRTEARVTGQRIEVRLAWRHRHANLDLAPASIDYEGEPWEDGFTVVLSAPRVRGVTLAGPSAWAELR